MKKILSQIGDIFAWVYNLADYLTIKFSKRFGRFSGLFVDFMPITEIFLTLLLVGIFFTIYLLLKLIEGFV